MKRLFAILLVAMLCFGNVMPVFAESFPEDADTYIETGAAADSTEGLDEVAEDVPEDTAEDFSGELTDAAEGSTPESIDGDISLAMGDSEAPDLTNGVVTGFVYEAYFPKLFKQKYQTDKLDLIRSDVLFVESNLDCVVELDGVEYTAMCTAVWSVNGIAFGEADLTVPGTYTIIAELSAPEGCAFADDAPTQLRWTILITEPGKQEIIGIFNGGLYSKGIMIAVGESEKWEDDIRHREEFISGLAAGITEDGDEADLILESFDTSDVDIDTPGEYVVTAMYRLHDDFADDFTISDEVRTLKIPIRVSNPADFDIWLGDMSADFFYLSYIMKLDEYPAILWTSSETLLEDAQLKTAAWSTCPEDVIGRLNFDGFGINREVLTQNRYYYFRLQSGALYSNIAYICDDGSYVDCGYTGGDRDGGDGNGLKPPVVEQPGPGNGTGTGTDSGSDSGSNTDSDSGSDSGSGQPPETGTTPKPPETSNPTPEPEPSVPPTTTPTPKPEPSVPSTTTPTLSPEPPGADIPQQTPVPAETPTTAAKQPQTPSENKPVITERFGETMDILSGARLRIMLETGSVKFSKQGVTVMLSDTALGAMNIQDSDSFTVEIERLSNNSFVFFISQNDVPLASLPDTQIMLPYQIKDDMAALTLQNEQSELVCEGSFNKAAGIASFAVDAPGSFSLVEREDTVPVTALSGSPISTEPTSPNTTEPQSSQPSPDGMSGTTAATALAIVLITAGGGVWLYRKRRWVK